MFNRITRAFYTSQFRKANAHYQAEKTIGNRDLIQRPGKESVEVILYRPKEIAHMPVFVQIHGGAWVGMDAVDDDEYCARISRELGAFVVNINYQRLYEKPFPYAQEECVDVVKWLISNADSLSIDRNRIVISGGSAGGHIAAGTAILLAQEGIKIAGQILEVPFLDFTNTVKCEFGPIQGLIEKMLKVYPPRLPLDHAVISPCVATKDILCKVADATIIVCGKDPLHPQGEAYAKRLKESGNRVELKMYEKGYHGFGTDKEDEKAEQNEFREDCFWYKINEAKRLYSIYAG